jgi:virginiamycin B lyase
MIRRLAFLALVPAVLAAQDRPVEMKEWTVPWGKEGRPRDPYVDPVTRKVWFVGQQANYVATLDPRTGEFKRFEIDSGAHPHTVVVDAQGNGWYAGNRNGTIGRIDGKTGAVSRFKMPPEVRDPHTMVFDKAGNLWFTAQQSNYVGYLNTKSGETRVVQIPTARARPYGIELDPSGRPWFDLFGTNQIGTVDPRSFELKTYTLPNERSRPRRIAVTPDGMVWWGDYSLGKTGRLDPRTGQIKEWDNPGGGLSLPYAFNSDDQGRLWFVETGSQPNRLVGFDPRTEKFIGMTTVPGGGGTVRHMFFDKVTGDLWYGADNGQIGKAAVAPRRPVS